MGLSFPFAVMLVVLEALTVIVFVLTSPRGRDGANSELRRRRWRQCFALTIALAAFPALLSVIEMVGDLIEGSASSATIKPLVFLLAALLFPALALHRITGSR